MKIAIPPIGARPRVGATVIVTRGRSDYVHLHVVTAHGGTSASHRQQGYVPVRTTMQLKDLAQCAHDLTSLFQGFLLGLPDVREARKGAFLNESADLFDRLFGKPCDAQLRALLEDDAAHVIQFMGDPNDEETTPLLFPWDLLVLSKPSAAPSVDDMLGLRHVVSHAPIPHTDWGQPNCHTLDGRNGIGVLAEKHNLEAVRRECRYLHRRGARRQSRVSELRPLEVTARYEDELGALFEFLRQPSDIIHFAGHARPEKHDLKRPHMRFDNAFECDVRSIERAFGGSSGTAGLGGAPFVILNGCSTGATDVQSCGNIALTWVACGARGAVGTICKVPDKCAYRFVRMLYRAWWSAPEATDVGDALLRVRRRLWSERHDPIGLAYALYGPPNIACTHVPVSNAAEPRSERIIEPEIRTVDLRAPAPTG